MAWSTTDWTPGNYQQYADEFWQAYNERATVVAFTTLYVPAAGANIQSRSASAPASTTGLFSMRYLQASIGLTAFVEDFVQSHDTDGSDSAAGTALDADYYDGESDITTWTTANLFLAVNGGTGWRRKANIGDAFSYGEAQEGDIFGPWICEDIQRALNCLVWTRQSWTFTRSGENNRKQGAGDNAAWATAKSDAETQYAASSQTYDVALYARAEADLNLTTGGQYFGLIDRNYLYAQATIPDDYAKAVDWYAYATKYPGYSGYSVNEFDANGDDVIENAHSLWLTENKAAACGDALTAGSALGSLTAPTWCAEPGDGLRTGRGYNVQAVASARYAVARWNVAGGFSYT